MNPVLGFERPRSVDFWRDNSIAMASGACLIFLLTTLYYFPALLLHRTLANGDISIVDLPFFDFFARVIKGQASPLWSAQLWGGHPLFAEGQGGFAHPVNIIWAAVVTPVVGPIYSMNLFYWLLKLLGGIGVMGLCRSLGASFWASTFAALALIFSPIWTNQQYVIPVYHTMTWIPWCLWALEVWLKRPTFGSTALLGGASALVLLSGYPQGLHGTMIYACATLMIVPFQSDIRDEWAKSWRKRVVLLLVVFAIGVGLSAVQLLPLLELVGQSHRSAGIGMPFAGLTPLTSYLRGLLVTDYKSGAGTGSLLVCILASSTLLLSTPGRIKGHMLATAVLLILGWERATPVFRFLYDHHLVPGLDYFRITGIYVAIASIGIAVSAASAIDRLSEWKFQPRTGIPNMRWSVTFRASYVRYALLATFWIWALSSLRPNWMLAVQIAIATVAGAAVVGLVKKRSQYLIAPVFAFVLTVEIFALRLHPFNFVPDTIFAKPPEVAAIQAVPDWREFKMMTGSLAGLIAFVDPRSPEFAFRVSKVMAAVAPMTNMLWDLPSMNGNLALALKRRTAIEDTLHDEIFGTVTTRPGLRLIDVLGVRFVTNDAELTAASFRNFYLDQRPKKQAPDDKVSLQENETALPRFQLYSRYEAVDTLEAAISAVKSMKMRTLVIENPDRHSFQLSPSDLAGASDEAAHIEVVKATDTEYRLKVSTIKPGWLFLADANYPGWIATVDDKDAPVFSAQVLGKAVEMPAGDHDVVIKFRSLTFYIGLLISMFTLTAVVLGAAFIFLTRSHLTLRSLARQRFRISNESHAGV